MSLPLHRAGLNVVGIDLSRESLDEYQRLAGKSLPLVAADALRLPFADKSFDWVIAVGCFDSFPQHREFLQAVNGVLVTGGLLIFDALNRRSDRWGLKRLVGRPLSHPAPNVSCDEVLRAAVSHGFNIREATSYNWVMLEKEEEHSRLLPTAARLEKAPRLDRWYQHSPRILVAATKSAACEAR